jgi:translation initiation factor IF-2
LDWAEDHWRLQSDLWEGEVTPSTTFAVELLEAFSDFGATRTLVPVSSATGQGLEDLYSLVQLLYVGGDDLEKR